MLHNTNPSELEKLNEIFDNTPKWKNKYKLRWCDLCSCASISYDCCGNSSCNCGGCDECINDPITKEFDKTKSQVEDYLTDEEKTIYAKSQRLKKFIITSLGMGDSEINWIKLLKAGKLSQVDFDLFKDLIYQYPGFVEELLHHFYENNKNS